MQAQMEILKLKDDKEFEDEDVAKGDKPRNWLELPPEVSASILSRLGSIEMLYSLQKVCKTWYKICKDPWMWKSIDMRNLGEFCNRSYDAEVMCRHAVDRSCNGLVDISLEYLAPDELLMYIADRAPGLKCLRVIMCYHGITNEGLAQMVAKLPLLEDLDLTMVDVGGEGLTAVGRCCPLLKSLKLNRTGMRYHHPPEEADEDALAIAETMPELRHLMLFGNQLTDKGLHAILDRCLHLQSLDLRQCFNINLAMMSTKLEKLRTERIKDLKLPDDSTAGYEYDTSVYNMDSGEVVGLSGYGSYVFPGVYQYGIQEEHDRFEYIEGEGYVYTGIAGMDSDGESEYEIQEENDEYVYREWNVMCTPASFDLQAEDNTDSQNCPDVFF